MIESFHMNIKFACTLLCLIMFLPFAPSSAQDRSRIVDDFEAGADRWWSYDDGSTLNCTAGEPGYNSNHALQLSFDVNAASYPGCGTTIETGEWADASGLSFMWRTDQPGVQLDVVLGMEDPTQTHPAVEGVTPFDGIVGTPESEWTQVNLPWTAFVKAEWVGDSGESVLDSGRVIWLIFEVAESQRGTVWIDELQLLSGEGTSSFDKFTLWTDGTQLRGANIFQRVVVPSLDGSQFLGDGHVGPPYVQDDFDRMAALGANYVNISGPGLFTERPPYVLDEAVQANLDHLLAMIEQADMFAVISFRTGPGRSDFTFYRDGAGVWFNESLLLESVWTDQVAQDAWVEMWRYAAERYRDNAIVVGYDLMVEPNGNAVGLPEPVYDADGFFAAYGGTLPDWNQFYPRLVDAIREVDSDTPLLVGAGSWSGVLWLPYTQLSDDPRIVYTVHQYEPQEHYTHQDPPATNTYPSTIDVNYDGVPDTFDRAWLDGFLTVIDDFKADHGVPVAVNEFGIVRWVPNAAEFMSDQMDLFEQRGLNYALWMFHPNWPPHAQLNDAFDFLNGPDPANHTNLDTSDLIEVVRSHWGRNTIRPSMVDGIEER